MHARFACKRCLYWVDQEFGQRPNVLGRACRAHALNEQEVAEALTMVVGFYVRVAHHLDSHDLTDDQKVALLELLGWPSWRMHGLVAFATCCGKYPLNGSSERVSTYFVERLNALEDTSVNRKPIKPEDRAKGVRCLRLSEPSALPR